MTLAIVHSRALDGLAAPAVTAEVHLANGLPSFTLVGLADTEVKEARERVRAALLNSGLEFPHNKRITVNLAPADLPKESGRFDLPIALGILAASGQIDAARLEHFEFAGELSLAGDLRPVRGALAMALAAHRDGAARTLVLPETSACEAALIEGLRPLGAGHLLDVVRALLPGGAAQPLPVAQPLPKPARTARLDLREVKGQAAAKRALEVAAAGGHSVFTLSTQDPYSVESSAATARVKSCDFGSFVTSPALSKPSSADRTAVRVRPVRLTRSATLFDMGPMARRTFEISAGRGGKSLKRFRRIVSPGRKFGNHNHVKSR
ncbi:MAG: ATP-binding protein [Methylibium sp.]|nr:ATP-binding protein [Methylibium sp.]